jgi:hypothetical protein
MVGGRRLLVDTLVDTLEATKWFRSNLRWTVRPGVVVSSVLTCRAPQQLAGRAAGRAKQKIAHPEARDVDQ